jgi:aminodeoxyfutalosine synthase
MATHSPTETLTWPYLSPPRYRSLNTNPPALPTLSQAHKALERAATGERIGFDDALALYSYPNLFELAAVADRRNQGINGRDVFFNVNRHINPTNICAMSCRFCAFSRKPGEEGGYTLDPETIAQKAAQAWAAGATEVHMVGGLHPRWRLDDYLGILRAVKSAAPRIHIKAFTAVELDWMARRMRLSIGDLLAALQEAGLGSLPGGGAEIFAPYVREIICDTKLTGDGWIQIHRTAHGMGLRSNCTMLYGHIEDTAARVDHMLRLRDLQDETGGFNVFIPLAYQPENNDLDIGKHTHGVDDLKTIAIARLVLDNFRNIKAYWVMTGPHMAQSALHFGANDLDGTVVEEKIANMAGSTSGKSFTRSSLLDLIRTADRTPVERSTTYEPIRRYDDPQLDSLEWSADQKIDSITKSSSASAFSALKGSNQCMNPN